MTSDELKTDVLYEDIHTGLKKDQRLPQEYLASNQANFKSYFAANS